MAREHVEKILAHIAELTGLANLTLDEEGRCGLLFDGSVGVELELDAGGDLRMSAVIGAYPLDLELPALREIAGANLGWAGTGGATLAANTEQHLVILQYREASSGLEPERFVRLLEAFLDTADTWRQKLARLTPDAERPNIAGFQLRV